MKTFPVTTPTPPLGEPLRVLPLLLLLFTVACVSAETRLEAPLKEGLTLYEGGRYDKAIEVYDGIIASREAGHAPFALARAYRHRAVCRIASGDYALARADLKAAERYAGRSDALPELRDPFLVECRLLTGDAYLAEGGYRSADRIYVDLLSGRITPTFQDRILYRRHLCAKGLSRETEAERRLAAIEDMRRVDRGSLTRALRAGPAKALVKDAPFLEAGTQAESPPATEMNILARDRWKARPCRSNVDPMRRITRITVHHTSDAVHVTSYPASADRMRAYQRFHQDNRGWADIGYHYVLDREGRIWEGREIRYQGAHAGNAVKNRGNIGISLMGNYNDQSVTPQIGSALVALLEVLCERYGLDPGRDIYTHRELHSTNCPGTKLQAFVDAYRRKARTTALN